MAKEDKKEQVQEEPKAEGPQAENQQPEEQVAEPDANEDETGKAAKKTKAKSGAKSKKQPKSASGKDKEKIRKLEDSLREQQEKYLRLSAEFDNYRKRTLKEKMDLTKYAGQEIFTRLLTVLDDMDRAMAHIGEANDIESLKEGIELIHNKFSEYLKQQGIKEIEAKNKEFDTDLHEAVTKIPAPEEELKGKVVDVIEKGYMLNEKVIRYAKVVIGE